MFVMRIHSRSIHAFNGQLNRIYQYNIIENRILNVLLLTLYTNYNNWITIKVHWFSLIIRYVKKKKTCVKHSDEIFVLGITFLDDINR